MAAPLRAAGDVAGVFGTQLLPSHDQVSPSDDPPEMPPKSTSVPLAASDAIEAE
jgi:hypothetical protein